MEARGKKWGVTRGARAVAIGAALWLAPSDAAAQAGKTGAAPAPAAPPSGPVIYPAKGQSPEKQQKDKTECYAWATQQTGYDPVAEAQAQQGQAAPAEKKGRRGPRCRQGCGSWRGHRGRGGRRREGRCGRCDRGRCWRRREEEEGGRRSAAGSIGATGSSRPAARRVPEGLRRVHGGAGLHGQVKRGYEEHAATSRG